MSDSINICQFCLIRFVVFCFHIAQASGCCKTSAQTPIMENRGREIDAHAVHLENENHPLMSHLIMAISSAILISPFRVVSMTPRLLYVYLLLIVPTTLVIGHICIQSCYQPISQ